MACRCDEVEQGVNTIVTEPWVALYAGLLCKDIIVLSLKVTNNFTETAQQNVSKIQP
jgi:hypothetical protein